MLCLSDRLHQIILRHAERVYPDECCGLLFGYEEIEDPEVLTEVTSEQDIKRRVVEVWDLENAWDQQAGDRMAERFPSEVASDRLENPPLDSKGRRYWIDPQDLFRAHQYVRAEAEAGRGKLKILGIYHSHPDHPAIPSECDRALAWSTYSYLIISVPKGQSQEICCWRLDEQQQFQSEVIQID